MQNGRFDRRRRNERITSQPRRQAKARGGGRDQRYRSARNYRTIRGTDTGYNLRKRSINFGGRRGGNVGRTISANPRPWVLGVAGLAVLALAVFGLARCVSSCSAQNTRVEVNEQDARVAVGVSSELTSELSAALDEGEAVASIAGRANELDERLVRLALEQPTAIGFVASYDPNGEHAASPYDSKVVKGYFTPVFCWDARWGSVDFAGGPLALTGSGPTSLLIAYLGLTGKSDLTPADISSKADASGRTDETLGLAAAFLGDGLGDLGLSATQMQDVTAARITETLDVGTVLLLQTKADGALGATPHWALASTENADGTVTICDPTSPAISEHPWAAATLANAIDAAYAVKTASAQGTATEDA